MMKKFDRIPFIIVVFFVCMCIRRLLSHSGDTRLINDITVCYDYITFTSPQLYLYSLPTVCVGLSYTTIVRFKLGRG